MKKSIIKILSMFLIIATFISSASFLVFAAESEAISETSAESAESSNVSVLNEKILSYSCHYIPSTKTINLKGSINYDAFSQYRDATIAIYSIPAGKSELEVINDESSKPVAEAPASISFAFSFKAKNVEDRHARYAVFFITSAGKYILTAPAQYAESEQTAKPITDKSAFKGFSGDYMSDISSANAKTAIIPVYLDSIFSEESSGYVYQLEEERFFFNETYVNELDSQIRSLSLFGTKVYLQFLLRKNNIFPSSTNDVALFALPDTSSVKTISMLHSVTDFIASRYCEDEYGRISGIILGKSWDNALKYNSLKGQTFDEYIFSCGNYAAIVANSARDINPNLIISLPFSGNGFYIEQPDDASSNIQLSSKVMISELMNYFDKSSYSGLKFSILVEAEETPLDITTADTISKIDIKKELPSNKFYIGRQNELSAFLASLSEEYKSANKHYSILWSPKKDLRGRALCAAYSYAFYASFIDESVVEFITEFSTNANNREAFADISKLFKSIDTESGASFTKDFLNLFNENSWNKILDTEALPTFAESKLYSASVMNALPKKIKGEFTYFDFSEAFIANNWIQGVGASEIKIDYLHSANKSLRSDLILSKENFSELIYYYDYPENISYTPYIAFDLEITSKKENSAYEINITFKGDDTIFESASILKSNVSDTIVIDTSIIKDIPSIECVKISVRCLDDSVENATLWIRSIKGYSKKYNNSELDELIKKAREDQKYGDDGNEESFFQRYLLVILLTTAFAILGLVLVFIIQKNSRSKRKE